VTPAIRLGLGGLFVVSVATGCSGAAGGPSAYSERFEGARVEIRVHYERATETTGFLVADFSPMADGIHLYGNDLPVEGIDGAGRPTRVAITEAGWHTTATPSASVASQLVEHAGFDTPFPVYPDGPVTLRQPVERTAAGDDGSIDAAVTFMACTTSGLCYVPIEDQAVSVPTR
jgi:hypothetical protein